MPETPQQLPMQQQQLPLKLHVQTNPRHSLRVFETGDEKCADK